MTKKVGWWWGGGGGGERQTNMELRFPHRVKPQWLEHRGFTYVSLEIWTEMMTYHIPGSNLSFIISGSPNLWPEIKKSNNWDLS